MKKESRRKNPKPLDKGIYQELITVGQNGFKYVDPFGIPAGTGELSFSYENSKLGPVMSFNLPVELTCDHRCECYREKLCYGCGGCYTFASNQAIYSRNYAEWLKLGTPKFMDIVSDAVKRSGRDLFRWFTCGDIPAADFLSGMARIARENPGVKFWTYTKKYRIVNNWIAANGFPPENLIIIFSHWRNKDGSFFPMDNPYNLPVSEFVPYGMEKDINPEWSICPCSDPEFTGTCATCTAKNPCHSIKRGCTMALLEHSTNATKQRDKSIRDARNNK